MAKTFRHNLANNYIWIDNDTGTESMYPYSWWITQEPGYTFPSGAAYLMYTEGGAPGQSYMIKNGNQTGLPLDPWPAADIYISKQALYDIAYADFLNAPTTLQQAKEQKVAQLLTKMVEKRQGKIIFSGNTFESGVVHYSRLKEERDYADYLTDVPVGYYVNDVTNPIPVQVSFTYTNLKDLVAGIEKLYHECFLNYDTHYAAIQALTTISSVQAYDVTTGWPTVPFTP
jgi:hypothetical protein